MHTYWLVAKNTWEEMLTYRLNFTMYRLRNVMSFLTFYFLWIALVPAQGTLFGYNQKVMLTYVIGTALLNAFVLSSRSYTVGDDIIQGNLSNYLIKPMHYFLYWLAKDVGDKAMNIAFAVIELTVLFFFLRPPLILPSDIIYIVFFFLSVFVAMGLYFCFNLLLGMIGFWSPEVWAPRFIFMILVSFFSGGYFPLDILPGPLFYLFRLLPFQYLLYFPLQVYLHRITLPIMILQFLLSLGWLAILIFFTDNLWRRGLLVYTAQGQ